MLITLVLLLLTNAIVVLMIFILLLSRSVAQSLRLTLIGTIICMILWQDSISIADNSQGNLVLLNTLIFVWPTLAILSCYSFIRALHANETRQNSLSRLTPFILGATFIQLLPVATLQVFSSAKVVDGSLQLGREAGYYVYLAGLAIALVCLVIEIIARRTRSKRHTLERYAIQVVLVTVIIASAYGVVMNVLVPLITSDQNLIGWGVLIVAIFTVGLSLSITRGKLIDIRFYAVRTTVYILSLGTLALVYAVVAFLLSQWLFGYTTSSLQSVVNVVLALLLAFIFQPIRHFFDHITNRLFYRDNYSSDEFFAKLNRLLTTTNDLRSLLERTATFIGTTLSARQAHFLVYHPGGHHISAGSHHHAKFPVADAHELDAYFGVPHHTILVTSDVTDEAMRRMLLSHGIEVILPLRKEQEVVGYLNLGEQERGGYSRRDIRILQTISNELVIAIQNALSVQEVKELNDNLQQRIHEATRELRASNSQLQRLDEAKDEFISMASHQLRTPLTSVKGYISMVVEGDAGTINEQQKHLLEEAFLSSERMVRLIGEFLNVSRLQTGKFMIEKHPTDLVQVVKQEIEGLKPSAQSRGLVLGFVAPKKFPLLNIDENKLRQVIMNFSDNAIYYSKEKTKITLSLKMDGSDVVFTVKDTGIGVPISEQASLFNKFFRATNARQQRPDGTGVGLFLAKKVIDAHHGTIIFESKEGKGSTFGFRLPLAAAKVETTLLPSEQSQPQPVPQR